MTYFYPNPNKPLRLTKEMQPGDVLMYLHTPLAVTEDRRLIDPFGNEYACEDELLMTDKNEVAGVGIFSLPASDPFTSAAKAHDFRYSSKVYQETHTRSEADEALREGLESAATSWWRRRAAMVCYWLARGLGSGVWEKDSTRWR